MIVTLEDLRQVRERTEGKIVLGTGTFDLFHYEHVLYLEEAKRNGDTLVIAVKGNNGARLKGPNRPIIDENQRIAIVDAIRYVDYSVITDYDENYKPMLEYDNESQRQWLVMFERLFEALKPDALYYEINPNLQPVRDRVFQTFGTQGIPKKRGKSISTSDVVKKLASFQ